ncbi:MAG: hypothetical protein HYZ17_01870 [Betaproteobacteria bacterium]|nr:hypothetical protein [Betaproteobacteria bacterium]
MTIDAPEHSQAPEQLRYARLLDWSTRVSFVVLVLSFAAYMLGLATPLVPPERLPQLWSQPVGQYLAATGAPTGWNWVRQLAHGDIAALLGIVLLVGCSLLCLLALLPVYGRRGDRAFVWLVLAEVMVMILAASGLLSV